MASRFQGAIDQLVEEVEAKQQEISELRRMVNFLRGKDGQPPLYPDVDDGAGAGRGLVALRPDEYYGKSPITAAREYLERRGQAALPEEIAEALERGSFDYKAQGWSSKENWGRNLAISMSKNSGIFHRLPNGYYGLVKWYPELKRAKRSASAQEKNGEEETAEEVSEIPPPRLGRSDPDTFVEAEDANDATAEGEEESS